MEEVKGFHARREIKPKKCSGCKCYTDCWKHLMLIYDDIEAAQEDLLRIEERQIIHMYESDLFDSAPHSLERLLQSACRVEDHPHCGVYFLIFNREIVYVGQSKNCLSRIQNHINDKNKIFDQYTVVYTDLKNLDFLESWYIHQFNPKYNKRSPFAWHELVNIGKRYMEEKNDKTRRTSTVVIQPCEGV